MSDERLLALKYAEICWKRTFYAEREAKLYYAEELHAYGIFSLNQLAKIVRLEPVALTRHGLKPNAGGGRFEPESLSMLVSLRKSKIEGNKLPVNLVATCMESGTSWSCAANLTGIPYSSYYNQMPDDYVPAPRVRPVKQSIRDAIVKALKAGADAERLAGQYNLSIDQVREISKAHGNV